MFSLALSLLVYSLPYAKFEYKHTPIANLQNVMPHFKNDNTE